ncbi:MAG: penicillin-binding protein 2 [Acidimicrobiia bacterium]|nr:penicillin-binding protein 2 [Acidimicrobiia bacterium]
MNRSIRRLGLVIVVCYLALFAQLNWVQIYNADELNAHPANNRQIQREFNRPRGAIVTADAQVIAESVPVEGAAFDWERRYPHPELFAHTTGWFAFNLGSFGLERTYSAELAGDTFDQQIRNLRDILVAGDNVGDLHLSLRMDLQEVARDALGDREGSVVALDPRTGELLAFWSYPSYDPNLLSTLDLAAADAAWVDLNSAPGNPLRANQYRENYFPGSTFKVVTAGAGLAAGTVTVEEPAYPVERSWTPPMTTFPISNFGGSQCGGTLVPIMAVSCNTAFARMGVETVGPELMISGSEAWGFNDAPPIDLPEPGRSEFPTEFEQDLPRLAQASIGQNDVRATPLQMALVAGAVANDGRMMVPTVVSEIRDRRASVVQRTEPQVWHRPLAPDAAAQLRASMVAVVESGTATSLATPGVEVGAKTGTAQLGTDPPRSHTWMIAFAGPPGDPQVALAVVVLNQPGDVAGATGGAVAGPVARQVMDAALAVQADRPPPTGADEAEDTAPQDPPTTAPTDVPTTDPPVTTVTTSPPTTPAPAPDPTDPPPTEPSPTTDPPTPPTDAPPPPEAAAPARSVAEPRRRHLALPGHRASGR